MLFVRLHSSTLALEANNVFKCCLYVNPRVDPLVKTRNGLRNNKQKLATASSRFPKLNLYSVC